MACVIAVALCTWASAAPAQATRLLDRFAIGVGTYRATSSTTFGARMPHDVFSTSVNLEDDLGFDPVNTLLRIRASALVGDHQGLSLDYYRYSHVSRHALARTLTWQGADYQFHAHLQGRVAFAFGSLAWRWWFGSGNDIFALGLGASHYRVSGTFSGQARVDGVAAATFDEDIGASTWAPLLQIGWRHGFGQHWRAYLDAAGVYKGGGRLSGHIYNASLGVEWLASTWLGFALEYGVNNIHVKRLHPHYDDSLDLKLRGPSAFAYIRF